MRSHRLWLRRFSRTTSGGACGASVNVKVDDCMVRLEGRLKRERERERDNNRKSGVWFCVFRQRCVWRNSFIEQPSSFFVAHVHVSLANLCFGITRQQGTAPTFVLRNNNKRSLICYIFYLCVEEHGPL